MNIEQRLFIYGTLAPGKANHFIMEAIPGTWQKASLCGTLIDEGWGAEMGCPGIIPTPDGENVEGFVFTSEHLSSYWSKLDDFEGEGYKRIQTIIKINDIKKVEAYVYALRQDT